VRHKGFFIFGLGKVVRSIRKRQVLDRRDPTMDEARWKKAPLAEVHGTPGTTVTASLL